MQLLTYHRAKGLEFDVVFLPRLLEGELPYKSGRSVADPQEERRLFYVGSPARGTGSRSRGRPTLARG